MGIPRWLDRFNFLYRFIAMDCEAPYIIYMESAVKPLQRLILGLVDFGWTDIVRSYFRPKGLRDARHGRKGRRGKRRRTGLPEGSELVAGALPGFQDVKGRQVTAGTKTLWRIDNEIQKQLFRWMIIDLVTDFLVETTFAIITSDRSKCSTQGRFCRVDDVSLVDDLLEWWPLNVDQFRYEQGGVSTWTGGATLPPGQWMVMVSGNAEKTTAGLTMGDLRVRTVPFDAQRYYTNGETPIFFAVSTGMIASGVFQGPCSIIWEARSTTGNIRMRDITAAGVKFDE